MRVLVSLVVILGGMAGAFVTVGSGLARQHADTLPRRRVPVLVELFTSEGCSSCPPADRLLASLAADQPVAGADIIVVSEHVDYWNRLGWHDPYSAAAFTERQRAYDVSLFRTGQIYTPQMIVAGHAQSIGSDRDAALDAIARAAGADPAVTIALVAAGPDRVTVRVEARGAAGADANVFLAVVEDRLTSQVRAGENAGRRLAHTAVARRLTSVGRLARGTPAFETVAPVPLDSGWNRQDLRLVAFAQELSSLRVLGVASIGWTGTQAGSGSGQARGVLY